MVAQPVGRTVCGVLTGAGLAQVCITPGRIGSSPRRGGARAVGLILAELIVTGLPASDAPVLVVVDDTVFRHRARGRIVLAGFMTDRRRGGSSWVRQYGSVILTT